MTAILLSGCLEPTGQVVLSESEKTDASVRLPIPVWNAWFAGFASAVDKGYYAEEGLDVTYNMALQNLTQ